MEDRDLELIVERLASNNDVSRSLLPLRGKASPVPLPKNFGVIRVRERTNATDVTLTWVDVEDYREAIASYNILLQLSDEGAQPKVVASPRRSPVTISVPYGAASRKATFFVQTVLKNGSVASPEALPAATATVQT